MEKNVKTKKDVMLAAIGAVVALLLLDLSPLGGNTITYVNAIRCGRWPLQDANTYTGGVPHYEPTRKFTLLNGYRNYFCNETEAERAGYSADVDDYDFPHLPASEFQQAIKKSQNL